MRERLKTSRLVQDRRWEAPRMSMLSEREPATPGRSLLFGARKSKGGRPLATRRELPVGSSVKPGPGLRVFL